MPNLYDFEADAIDGTPRPLKEYEGKVVLVVNTATHCGFTPQLEGLQDLYTDLHDRGLEILGFPCDQFGHQNAEDDAGTEAFCTKNYGVTFPMFSKVDVNGKDAHPVFAWLRKAKGGLLGDRIKWNFTKFLVDQEGNVVGRFGSTTKPEAMRKEIEKLL